MKNEEVKDEGCTFGAQKYQKAHKGKWNMKPVFSRVISSSPIDTFMENKSEANLLSVILSAEESERCRSV